MKACVKCPYDIITLFHTVTNFDTIYSFELIPQRPTWKISAHHYLMVKHNELSFSDFQFLNLSKGKVDSILKFKTFDFDKKSGEKTNFFLLFTETKYIFSV